MPASNTGSYPATAFGPEFAGGRAGGKLVLTPGGIRFQSPSGSLDFPWGGLMVRLGGHDGRQVFFEHSIRPQASMTTSSSEVLQDPLLADRVELRQQLAASRRVSRSWPVAWVILAAVGLVVISGIVWFVLQKDRWVRLAAERIPAAMETELGGKIMESLRAEGRLIKDPAYKRQVDAISSRLLTAVANSGYAFEFHVLQDTNLNAFALPGGQVVIHTGLLKAAASQEEIAGVLAHEIAHVTQRHGLRKLIETAGMSILFQSLFGDVRGLEGVVLQGSQALLQQKYSRDFEREADEHGWEYLLEADVDPRGMISFFKKLQQQEAKGGAVTAPAFLSTHPATEERIRSLEMLWEKSAKKAGFRPIAAVAAP